MNEAPDKIYVDTEIIAFYDLELKGKEDTEYLRKDALLEWVKERLDKDVGIGLNAEEMLHFPKGHVLLRISRKLHLIK